MTGTQRPAAVCACCGMAIKYMLKAVGRQDDPEFVREVACSVSAPT